MVSVRGRMCDLCSAAVLRYLTIMEVSHYLFEAIFRLLRYLATGQRAQVQWEYSTLSQLVSGHIVFAGCVAVWQFLRKEQPGILPFRSLAGINSLERMLIAFPSSDPQVNCIFTIRWYNSCWLLQSRGVVLQSCLPAFACMLEPGGGGVASSTLNLRILRASQTKFVTLTESKGLRDEISWRVCFKSWVHPLHTKERTHGPLQKGLHSTQ